jgi:UDP-N-acetylmuramoylalanine--D-glutamate ligase
LVSLGAHVEVIDGNSSPELTEKSHVLELLGADVHLGFDASRPVSGDLVVPSPGIAPHHPWLKVPADTTVWSAERLAWQLRDRGVPWLTLTGTNGKTTTAQMLHHMLVTGGRRSVLAGNVGRPLVEAVMTERAAEWLVVELSSFQLHWTPDLHAHTSSLLNLAPDHLDWHGSWEAYRDDKERIFDGTEETIVYNQDDPNTVASAEQADVVDGCRAVGFTLGVPSRAMLGVVDDVLVDRAFNAERATHAVEIVAVSDLRHREPHNVANALAAAAVARSAKLSVEDINRALASFEVDEHRGEVVEVIDEVRFVDNSKATNTHAADVALAAEQSVVWVAGGTAKGVRFDDLVTRHRDRLRAVVVMGVDGSVLADALGRHAPTVPVFQVDSGETDPMDRAVRAAVAAAQPHDTVLLAPACASTDMFDNYRARGLAFADAVRRLRR